MMMLIEANDNVVVLNRAISELAAGGQIREDKYGGLLRLSELIYENSSLFVKDSDEAFARFMEIATDMEMTTEEKYKRLMAFEVH